MSTKPEYHYAREAMEQIFGLGLLPTPENYDLFYRLQEGKDIKLTSAFRILCENNLGGDQDSIDILYNEYISNKALYGVLASFGDKLSDQVSLVQETIRTSFDDHEKFATLLDSLKTAVAKTEDPAKIANFITAIIKANNNMQGKTIESKESLNKMQTQMDELRSQVDKMRRESLTDELTNIGNRRQFERLYAAAVRKALNNEVPLTVCMIDVDHFKKFNDKWGHVVGDSALQNVASLLSTRLKDVGVVCRYGGEEFIAILPNVSAERASQICDAIRHELSKTTLVRRDNNEPLGNITASFGLATLKEDDTADSLLKRADAFLYDAKKQGRNCLSSDHDIVSVSDLVANVQRIVKASA